MSYLSLSLISTKSLSVNPPIIDLITATNGISCNGLSIIFNKLIIVWISMLSKYSADESLNTGIPKFKISFSNIGAGSFVDLNKTTMSLYFISLFSCFFASYIWNLFSTSSLILFATNFASNSIFSTLSISSSESFSSSFVSFQFDVVVVLAFCSVSISSVSNISISAFKSWFVSS